MATRSAPDLSARLALARRHEADGRLGPAEDAYRMVLLDAPNHPDVLRALALILHRRGKATAARHAIERSIAAEPRAETLLILSGLHQATRNHGKAVEACRCAAALAPADPAPLIELAGVLVASGDYPGAESALDRALILDPSNLPALVNLGSARFRQGRFAEARDAHLAAVTASPGLAVAWKNLGAAERQLADYAAAHAAYAKAVRLAPDYAEGQRDLALLELLLGDLPTGFARYEWRLRAWDFAAPVIEGARWDGSPALGRTVLLHFEQGFGDTVQFLRFVPAVAARCGRVLLRVQKPLERLAASVAGVDRVVPAGERLPHADCQAHMLSLPHLLGLTEASVPAQTPYLSPPPDRVASWRERLPRNGPGRIGIVWSGNPDHENDRQRSIDPALLAPLIGRSGCVFHSLNPNAEPPAGIDRLPGRLTDFAETAAVIANMDLVIAVDTAAAHLAGALGCKLWLLLPFVPDWRWQLGREDSPWYPTARLFRQSARRDWAEVIARVAAALTELFPNVA